MGNEVYGFKTQIIGNGIYIVWTEDFNINVIDTQTMNGHLQMRSTALNAYHSNVRMVMLSRLLILIAAMRMTSTVSLRVTLVLMVRVHGKK